MHERTRFVCVHSITIAGYIYIEKFRSDAGRCLSMKGNTILFPIVSNKFGIVKINSFVSIIISVLKKKRNKLHFFLLRFFNPILISH